MATILETDISIIGPDVKLEGELELSGTIRVYGTVRGTVNAREGSTLILMESSVVEGKINADEVRIAGFVKGSIFAKKRATIETSGRVIGSIQSPKFEMNFGAYLEGEIQMPEASSPA